MLHACSDYRPASAATGSSRAARRAGKMPNAVAGARRTFFDKNEQGVLVDFKQIVRLAQDFSHQQFRSALFELFKQTDDAMTDQSNS